MRTKAFKLFRKTNINDLKIGDHFSESDLSLQSQDHIYQFKFKSSKKNHKATIKPGIYQIGQDNSGLVLNTLDFSKKRILTDIVNTKAILDEASSFFSKIDIYKELDLTPKRGILLYSAPGFGKSATLSLFSQQAVKEDPGTVVIVWPTSKIEPDDFQEFLAVDSKYAKNVTRLILIMEDIGGGNDDSNGPRQVSSGLLNLLDGVGEVFKVPTFIAATTNNPERLLSSLSDRPGRFDVFLELLPPSKEERLKLFEFIIKREATEEEKESIQSKTADGLSVAHITEIVIRHRLKDLSVKDIIRDMVKHTKAVKTSFESAQSELGF